MEGCRQQSHPVAAPAVLQPFPNEGSAPLGHGGGIQPQMWLNCHIKVT